MLDENLPTFYLKPSPDGVRHHEAYYLTYHGSEPEATYTYKHLDPASPTSKATYASALFDAFNPSILYGEVNVTPEWLQPTLSQDEIRKNGGQVPAPQPIIPQSFAIQLYDPDQQVTVTQKLASWGGNPSYTFSMPIRTFRLPTKSSLDRGLDDPAADATTPRINFIWKREGKLSKDWTCFLTGKSTDPKKKKSKEPDIAVALFSRMQEVTIYQSNFSRVDMEDPKGLEIVLLLSIGVIRDLYLGGLKDTFNIHGGGESRKNSGGLLTIGRDRKSSSPAQPTFGAVASTSIPPTSAPPGQSAAVAGLYAPPPARPGAYQSGPTTNHPPPPGTQSWQPPTQPHSAPQPDARMTAERRKRDEAEAKRIRKMLEVEEREAEKERKRREKAIKEETERLKKQFGDQSSMLSQAGKGRGTQYHRPPPNITVGPNGLPYRPAQPHPHTAPLPLRPNPSSQLRPSQPHYPPRPNTGYLNPGPPSHVRPHSAMGHSSSGQLRPSQPAPPKKKSFWNLRGDDSAAKLNKKRSSIF
ncbi:hypothetical protein P152DRAFT_461108 [Eremomyces bilateralis CBS 781.70]|uniref:Uncharacterized protein n=1 Tax=Eremomyces bilateralis CBS 781.70 TaxID=1392243 RepID=A0A6G1FVL2_9PEZI|nr:uncharacterized protein P152DRAFT_461108 [Eremomyces bilateralis CBS 781.70]KAF1809722.1 hypothetical protein P152DRAFT_461108 [Eremomyces bilateralis CBS 781.70]